MMIREILQTIIVLKLALKVENIGFTDMILT